MNIVIDVFGGDNAPKAILEGCVAALSERNDFSLILTGDASAITVGLSELGYEGDRIRIVHAPDVISCDEKPTTAIKQKKESSLVKALNLVASGEAEAIVSAGSTGAVLAGATLLVRRIKGVKRPALAPMLPTLDGPVLLIDCGANVDCKPEYLKQFAIMGAAYMERVMGVANPRVGLINNGAEAEKGNDLTKAVYPMLETAPINFLGNCEARDILTGKYDVLVCDGFVGNVVLKYTEGLAASLMSMLKQELTADARSKIGAKLSSSAYKRFKKRMDYTEYGGAPLLGINGGIIKAHGSSNAKAIKAAINQACDYVLGNVTKAISETISALPDNEEL